MGLKNNIVLAGVGLLALVALAKPIGGLFGQVGSTVGGAFQMGLQNFVSSLSGGLIPNASGTMSNDNGMNNMMGSNGMNNDMNNMMNLPKRKTVVIVQTPDTGTADIPNGAGRLNTDNFGNTPKLTPEPGAIPITIDTIQNFFNMLEGKFSTISEDIPNIGQYIQDYLSKGGMTLEGFTRGFKLPSGLTLEDIIGFAGKGVTPEVFGALSKSPTYAYQNFQNPSYVKTINSLYGLHIPIPNQSQNNDLVNIYTSLPPKEPLSGLVDPNSLKQGNLNRKLQMMNLNMDNKIDTPQGTILYGSSSGSIGAGKGSLLPARTLTEVIRQHPEFSASQAADYLARTMMGMTNFDYGSNTGAGLISTFDKSGNVIQSMINPVILAYQNYKAMYGIS